jgi:hypothetical protein
MPTTYRISIKLIKERDIGTIRIEKEIRSWSFRYITRANVLRWWELLSNLMLGELPEVK